MLSPLCYRPNHTLHEYWRASPVHRHPTKVCTAAVDLTGKQGDKVTVLYLGTATYDIEKYKTTQTVRFAELGCTITELKVAVATPPDMAELVGSADIIVVSGGNTLYSCDR